MLEKKKFNSLSAAFLYAEKEKGSHVVIIDGKDIFVQPTLSIPRGAIYMGHRMLIPGFPRLPKPLPFFLSLWRRSLPVYKFRFGRKTFYQVY